VHVPVHVHNDISPGRPFAPAGAQGRYTPSAQGQNGLPVASQVWVKGLPAVHGATLGPVQDYL